MKVIYAIVLFLLALPHLASAGEPTQRTIAKTPVEIKGLSVRGKGAEVQAIVHGATASSQVVIFVRYSNRPGLSVATDELGQPLLPTTSDILPPDTQGDVPSRQTVSRWSVSFHSRPEFGRLLELYAVVCTTRERGEWSRERDYRGFQYLPFSRTGGIDDALDLLRDFGWIPTGLTKVAP